MPSSLEIIGWRLKEAAAPMKGRASHGCQVPVPHVIPWFFWMSHCPQPIGLFNGIPQSSGFEHTSTGAYPAFLRFTGNVVSLFGEPRGSQLRLMRFFSQAPSKSLDLGEVIDVSTCLIMGGLVRRHNGPHTIGEVIVEAVRGQQSGQTRGIRVAAKLVAE